MASTDEKELENKITTVMSGFLLYLQKEKKTHLLPHIVTRLKKQMAEDKKRITVISAVPLKAEQMGEIKQIMQEKFSTDLIVSNRVDKKILGGIVIRFGDIVIDQSLRTKLERMQQKVYGS